MIDKWHLKKKRRTTINRFVDLIVLYEAYNRILKALEDEDSGLLSSPELKTQLNVGKRLIRRHLSSFNEGYQNYIVPVVTNPDLYRSVRNKRLFKRSLRPGNPILKAQEKVDFMEYLLPFLKRKGMVFFTLFPNRSKMAAQDIVRSIKLPVLEAIAALALVTPISGWRQGQQWVKKVAKIIGAPVSALEEEIETLKEAIRLGEVLEEVTQEIKQVDPDDSNLPRLEEKRNTVIEQVVDLISDSENPVQIKNQIVSAAAQKGTTTFNQATEIGKKLGMSPDQEVAMLGTGRKIIAAGAGSGKTRVLAGEVVFRINEQGYDPKSVCAVSFTRASSQELVERAQNYGAVISGAAQSGFGTTHSIAGRTVLNKYSPASKRGNYFGKDKQWCVTVLISLAVKQISFPGGNGKKCPKPQNMFNDDPIDVLTGVLAGAPVQLTLADDKEEVVKDALVAGLNDAQRWVEWTLDQYWVSGGYRGYLEDFLLGFVRDMKNKIESGARRPSDVTSRQKVNLRKALDKAREKNYLRISGEAEKLLEEAGFLSNGKTAAAENPFKEDELAPSASYDDEDEKNIKKKSLSKYYFWNNPARQWFNLNFNWSAGGEEEGGAKFGAADVRQKISIWKGKGASPQEAWWGVGAAEGETPYTPEAAAYAAYEWLKSPNGEPDFKSSGDFSDLLIDAARALAQDTRALEAIQRRFKIILVDEAQDLNRTQHILFGLMSGYLDPKTLEPNSDGSMTADVFAFIGDDKQAIYEFRGADPDEFIEKSDLYKDSGGNFSTYLLKTNYRSGQAIVDAANNLIKHNTKQIPMECVANYDVKGMGSIKAYTTPDEEGAADMVASQVKESADMYETEDKRWSNFGIAVRSNREADIYALSMIKEGIPFISKRNPLNKPHLKAMLGWMTVVNEGPGGNKEKLKQALIDARRFPTSFLGNKFVEMVNNARNPINWITNIDLNQFRRNYRKRIEAFQKNVFHRSWVSQFG